MAQALGGKVEKSAAGWGIGPVRYRTKQGEEFELHAMHQDQVVRRPPEAEVIASSEHCENAAFAYKGKALSFQPHPEFSAAYTRDLIESRKGTVIPAEQAEKALAATGRKTDDISIAGQIVAFFRRTARKAA
jgi:GMP synthase (glutamine-hydrolysing)